MPFEKGYRIPKWLGSEPLDREAITFKPRMGVTDKIRQISNWQARLRSYADLLVMRYEKDVQKLEDGEI